MIRKDFISKWISILSDAGLKNFPDEYIDNFECKKLKMPGSTLVLGSELFGSFEIVSTSGNVEMTASSFIEAKYFLYASRTKPNSIKIPKKKEEIISVVKNYEKDIDSILRKIEKDFMAVFPFSPHFPNVSAAIFTALNIHRY